MKTAWGILREESLAAMGLSRGKDEALSAAYQKYLNTKESENENNDNNVTQLNND
jgi:hypothetical protein